MTTGKQDETKGKDAMPVGIASTDELARSSKESPLPCCYCGSEPVLEMAKPEGTVWDHCGRYACRSIGCPGQENRRFAFGYLRIWNQRQKYWGRAIAKAKAVIPALVAHAR